MGVLPSSLPTSFPFCRISLRSKKNKTTSRRPKRLHQHTTTTTTNFPYPKSSPTPLLLDSTTHALSREQALDRVLAELESALARGVRVDASVFSSLLETCARARSLSHGARLHRLIPPRLLRSRPALSSKLLRLYATCGLLDRAHRLFDRMPQRNRPTFAWNSLISGYVELGLYEDAMALYHQMEEDGVEPDRFTFPRVLKACAGIGSVRLGEATHRHAVRCGVGSDAFVLNALVDMYAKCGDIVKARGVFDKIPDRDVVSWNAMLTGYMRHGLLLEALDVCREMIRAGIEPDSVTLSALLAGLSLPTKIGLEVHGWALRRGLEQNPSVSNSLIRMYSEDGRLDRARLLFESMPEKDLVSWNAIIAAHRRDQRVLVLFKCMEESGVVPDQVTFVSLLSACANLGLVEDGRWLFSRMEKEYAIRAGMEHYGCMVNLLGRAGLVDEAYELVSKRMPFDGGPTVWGALLYACAVYGNLGIGEVAAERLFELEPDNEHNFELLMRIYSGAGRLDGVENVRRLMRERGLEEKAL